MKESAVLFVSFQILAAGTLVAGSALPRYGFSVPAVENVAEAIHVSEQCGAKGKVLFLAPLTLDLGAAGGSFERAAAQERILAGLAEGSEAFLRIRVRAGALTGKEPEKVITDRVSEFLARLPLAAAPVRGLVVEIEEPATVSDLFSFALLNIAVKAKGAKTDLQISFFFPPGFPARQGDLVKRLARYSDSFGTTFTPGWRTDVNWIAEQALNRPVVLRLEAEPSAEPGRVAEAYLHAALETAGTSVDMIWVAPGNAKILASACAVNDFLGRFIKSDFTPMAPGTSRFTINAEGVDRGQQKWFADGKSPDVGAVVRIGGARDHPKNITVSGPAGQFDIQWYDPIRGDKLKPGDVKKTEKSLTQAGSVETEYAFLFIHASGSAEERAYAAVEVTAKADLSVEEIIARWQQYRESQRQKLSHYTAACFMNLHFESTNMGSGFDISMQMKQFANRSGLVEWAQTEFYVNGVKFKKQREFPLPQLEPEKVMTQPLELKLNEKYDYKLLGTEQAGGIYTYVVGIEPTEPGETLYSGKVWIDGTTFRQVKVHLRQQGAKSNVVANAETQNFEIISDGKGNDFNLITSIYAQQTLNAAGRNFILQKTYRFSEYAINMPEFDGALAAAHASDVPMYRETEAGLRTLRKEGNERVAQAASQKRVRSLIGGALYEGTFNFPIPLLGVSLVDFNFRKSGSQLSVFFAGPILAGNLSKQWRSKFRLGLDLAVSGLPGNNRVFSGDTEVKSQNLWVWEETTGVRATWQANTNLSLTGSTYFVYERYRATSDADKAFVLPRNGFTTLPTVELKYARRGYVFTGEASEGRRFGWTQFGLPGPTEPFNQTFTRYYADFGKSLYFGRFTKTGFDFAYYGGDRLDRFSRYRPSFFSKPRILERL